MALLLSGCKYESPLTKEHHISVDAAVFGLWELIPDEGEEEKQNKRMMILKYSDTEYLIHYPIGKNGLYFRGYAIVIGGVSCVQLQVIGADDGPPKEGEKDLFHVVAYQVMHGKLEVKMLNSDLVDDNLKVAETLEAFLHYRDHKELFTDPGSFRRIDG